MTRTTLTLVLTLVGCTLGGGMFGGCTFGGSSGGAIADADDGPAQTEGGDGAGSGTVGPPVGTSQDDDTQAESDTATTGPPQGARRRVLTLDQSNGLGDGLGDAPLLVVLDPSRIEYEATLPQGADLSFVTAQGDVLPHEIERWQPGGVSHVWVRLPATAPDLLFMVYATGEPATATTPGAVWDDRFQAVWHFADPDDATTLRDATAKGHDGLAAGAWRTDDAMLGPGFDATTGTIVVDDAPALTGGVTVEAWVRRAAVDVPIDSQFVAVQIGAFALRVQAPELAQPRLRVWRVDTGTIESGPMFSLPQTWSYVVASYADGKLQFFVDGASASTEPFAPLAIASSTDPLHLGRRLQGTLDEVRISAVARPDAWISAQYRSMTDAVLTFGDPEPLP